MDTGLCLANEGRLQAADSGRERQREAVAVAPDTGAGGKADSGQVRVLEPVGVAADKNRPMVDTTGKPVAVAGRRLVAAVDRMTERLPRFYAFPTPLVLGSLGSTSLSNLVARWSGDSSLPFGKGIWLKIK